MASIELQVRPATSTAAGEPVSITDVGRIWQAALDEYETLTGIRIQAFDGANNIEGVLSEITKDEDKFKHRRHDGSKLDKFRTLVAQSLGPIEKLGSIANNAAKGAFPPSEAVFATIRYLISTANAVSADYDKVAAVFEDIKSYLHRLKVLEHQVPAVPELELVITEVLTSIMVLCGISTKYIRTKRLALRSLVSGEDADLKAAYDRFHKMVEREEGVVRNTTLVGVTDVKSGMHSAQEDLKAVLAQGQHTHAYLANQETEQERNDILAWLSLLEFLNRQHAVFDKHHQGTGQWLLDSDTFQTWFGGEENSTLWCPGDAGAGKTVMVSTVVSYIDEKTERSDVAVAFVYCDYGDPRTRSEVEILSSITRQLAEQCRPLPPELKAFHDKHSAKVTRPTADERASLIRSLAQYFKRAYVLVDALDECPKENRAKFLRLAKEIEGCVRLFITSRPILDLQGKFSNLSRIDIVAHESDIRAYLESVINADDGMNRFSARDRNLKADVVNKILTTADGMFLLAHLQAVHICSQSSLRNVRRALDSLPKGLYAFYEIAMARITEPGEHSSMVATTALSYVFCARRPLRVDELLQALSVEEGDTELYEDALPDIEFVLDSCAGLIRADLNDCSVGLVHHTLREYLQQHPGKILKHPDTAMARVCLTYLAFDEFETGPCSDGESLDRRLRKYRFLRYASLYWGHHFQKDQSDNEMDLLRELLRDPMKLASLVQVSHAIGDRRGQWYDNFPKQVTPLHVAAHWGLDKVVAMLLQGNVDVDSQDSEGTTALQLAAQHGHLQTVRLLLEQAAQVDITDHGGLTALAWASWNGHKAAVELLLEQGANILGKSERGWTPLDFALHGGHTETAKVLLGHCTDVGMKRCQLNMALVCVARAGELDLLTMLLDEGAQIDWKDERGHTALTTAVLFDHEKVACALIERGADVNASDSLASILLLRAITFPRLVRLLLEHGAVVNERNEAGRTALHCAVEEGRLEVVGILLEFGSDVNARDVTGRTALHAAALSGDERMAQLLLDKGADPNLMDEDGWTSLHPATLKQHAPIVDMLASKVEKGHQIIAQLAALRGDEMMRAVLDEMADRKSAGSTVDVEHVGKVLTLSEDGAENVDAEEPLGGLTTLTLAARLGSTDLVQELLENGARVNKPGRNGWTAMHYAVDQEEMAMVRLLVRHKADLEVRVRGWTPLLMALRDRPLSLAEYLIRKGANVHAADYHGRTVLHWAALRGLKKLLPLLLRKGVDVNAPDRWGRTPLICALQEQEPAVARTLLNAGADAAVAARDGTTALHMAAFVGDRAIAPKLLARGADCNAAAQGGLTALHVAVFMGHDSVASLLLEKGADASGASRWCVEEHVGEEGDGNLWPILDESLCPELRRLFNEHKPPDDVGKCGSSFTTQQLANIGGYIRVIKLLKKHKARACQRSKVTSRFGALRLGSFDLDVNARSNIRVASSLNDLSEKTLSGTREVDQIPVMAA